MSHRWHAVMVGVLLAGATTTPYGPSATRQAIDRMNATSMRGVPTLPAPPPQRPMVWVPDRYVSVPGAPEGVLVPGHWEPILPDGTRLAPQPPLPVAQTP